MIETEEKKMRQRFLHLAITIFFLFTVSNCLATVNVTVSPNPWYLEQDSTLLVETSTDEPELQAVVVPGEPFCNFPNLVFGPSGGVCGVSSSTIHPIYGGTPGDTYSVTFLLTVYSVDKENNVVSSNWGPSLTIVGKYPKPDTGTATDTDTDTNTDTDTDIDTGTSTYTETGTATDTSTATGTETLTGTGTSTLTGTATETATVTGTGTETSTDTGTGTITDSETGTGTGTGTETGTDVEKEKKLSDETGENENQSSTSSKPDNAGDPVNIKSGSFYLSEKDLTLKSRLPLSLARAYNSKDPNIGPFGRGWSTSFGARLVIGDSDVVFIDGDGSRIVFRLENGVFVGSANSTLRLTKDSGSGQWCATNPRGNIWKFNPTGNLIAISNTHGDPGVTFEYDTNGRLNKMANPAGQWMQFACNADGRVVGATDSTGRTVFYTYDGAGNLVGFTNALGQATSYGYTPAGLLCRIERPGNIITQVEYRDNRAVAVTGPNGESSTFAWASDTTRMTYVDPIGVTHEYKLTANGDLESSREFGEHLPLVTKSYTSSNSLFLSYTDSLGHTTNYGYDQAFCLATVTNALGHVIAFAWDHNQQQITKKTDALGRTWRYEWNGQGRLLTETDPAGKNTRYTYDNLNNCLTRTDPLGRVTRYVYDQSGSQLLKVIDPLGNETALTYDARGNILTLTDPKGQTTSFEYDSLDRLTKRTGPDGRFLSYEFDVAGNLVVQRDELGRETKGTYDKAGNLLTKTYPDGTTLVMTYDNAGLKLTETDGLNRVTKFAYDGFGRVTSVVYPDGTTMNREYDTEGRLVTQRDALGNETKFEYDPLGRVLAVIDPAGSRWQTQYDLADRKTTETDPLGRITGYTYDPLDRVTELNRPDGKKVKHTYDAVGNLLTTTDALGNTWTWNYDDLNRQVKAVRPDQASMTWEFDPVGNLLGETDPLGHKTGYTYDAGNRRTTIKDATGQTWRFNYDRAGRMVSVVDPLGGVSSKTYDLMDRLTSESDALGRTTRFEFDSVGRQVGKIDALGRRTKTEFDALDRVLRETDPEGRTVSYGYDAVGRKLRFTDGANRVWQWSYDVLGRVLSETDPQGQTVSFAYDVVGNRVRKTNARSERTTYAYDVMDQLVRVEYPNGDVATFGYDAEGREISRTGAATGVLKSWDAIGNLTAETFLPWNKAWKHTYDKAGNRIESLSPENEKFVYGYDPVNRLTVLDPPSRADTIKFAFDAAGRMTGIERPGVRTTSKYDAANQVTEIRHERLSGSSRLIASMKYAYDAVGNRLTLTDEANQVTRFGYDGSNFLKQVTYPGNEIIRYAYNGAGDRLSEAIGSRTPVLYEYDTGGRLTKRGSDVFEYDKDGNLVRSVESQLETKYAWSADNRLLRMERDLPCSRHGGKSCRCAKRIDSEVYGYLPEDWRRVTRTADGLTFVSVFDGDDESHEYLKLPELPKLFCKVFPDWKTPRLSRIREFVSGPGADDIESVRYYGRGLNVLKDALGSTIAVTNRDGHAMARVAYDAWGNFRWPANPKHLVPPCREDALEGLLDRFEGNRTFGLPQHDPWHHGRHFARVLDPYLFTGRRWEPFAGLYNNRNRFYNPRLGRFASRDPIGFRGGNNLYAYGNLNPLLYTDPFGFAADDMFQRSRTDYDSRVELDRNVNRLKDMITEARARLKGLRKAGETGSDLYWRLETYIEDRTDDLDSTLHDLFILSIGDSEKDQSVINVTSDGVALPPDAKYQIPQRFIPNPFGRAGSYGEMVNGKFVERIRIDPATPGWPLRGQPSHYHLDGKNFHYYPGGSTSDPGFPK